MAAHHFNDVVHAPNRLRICALLAGVRSAEFSTVRETLGVADSVLSKHVAVLHDWGYVEVHKSTCASRVRTSLSLTPAGSAAYEGHIPALRAITEGGSPVGLKRGAAKNHDSRPVIALWSPAPPGGRPAR
jgi:DNA-binding MarR family transcriptional regulator